MKRFAPRRILLLLTTALCAAALPPLLLETALRLAGYGYSPRFFVPIRGASAFTTNQMFGRRFFPVQLARTPVPQRIASPKPSGTFRIFVLGESAAMGFPEPGFSFGRQLEAMLRRMYPERRFEVIQASMTAINSHVLLPIARECAALQPDLFIVYAGNNEVVGPFGSGTVFTRAPRSLGLVRAAVWLSGTRTGQWLSTLERRGSEPSQWRGMEMFLGHSVAADDARLPTVYASFRRNLEEICRIGRRAGAAVVISTVPVNLKDTPPFASENRVSSDFGLPVWQQYYREGIALAAKGDRAEALRRFDLASRTDDGFAELRYRRAQLLLALGGSEDAAREFAAARDLDTLRFRADSHINQMIRDAASASGGTLVDAERLFGLRGNDLFYEHVHLNFAGNGLLACTLLPAVTASLHLTPAAGPEPAAVVRDLAWTDWDDYRARADIAAMMQRPPFALHPPQPPAPGDNAMKDAEAQYREILRLRPDDFFVRQRLADLLASRGELALAELEWRALLARVPDVEAWRIALASVLANQNKLDDAMEEYRQVLRTDPQSATAQFGAGSVRQRQRHWEEALRYYSAALRLNPNYAEVENNLGLMRMESAGDAAGAASHYRKVLDMNEAYPEAHNNLALALEATADAEGAIAHYRRALALNSSLPGARSNLAAILARRGRIDEAVSVYEAMLQEKPEQFEAHYNLGGLFARAGKMEAAREHLRAAVRLRPDSAAAHYDLGSVLSRQGALHEAVAEYNEALRLRPDYAEAWNNLGSALARSGNMERAIRCFQKAIALRPDFAAAHGNLAAAVASARR